MSASAAAKDIRALGRKIGKAPIESVPGLAADLVAILATVDGRRPPRLGAETFTPEEAAEVRHLCSIEADYASEEPVAHDPPKSGRVIDHLRARLDARARREDGFNIFAELVGTYADDTGAIKFLKQSKMHREWELMRRLHILSALICSINSGKTTQSVLYVCWLLGRNHNLRIGLLGNTASQSADLLRSAQSLLLSEAVTRIFPTLKPAEPWSTTQAQVQRSLISPVPSLSAFGTTGFQGKRFDVILADDITDRENTATEALIAATNDWWDREVETRRWSDKSKILYCSTPRKRGDLTAKLQANPLYAVGRYPLVDEAGKISWPEHWTPKMVAEKRASMSPLAFATMCLCQIRTNEEAAFTEEMTNAACAAGLEWPAGNAIEDFELGTFPEGTIFLTSCDPASGSSKRRRDDTGLVTAAILPDGTHVILYAYSGRAGLADAKKLMAAQCERWPVKALIIETNGGQHAWLESLRAENLPAVEHVTGANRLDGAVGIESMGSLFRNRKVIVPQHVANTDAGRKLIAEVLFWEPAAHTGNVHQAWWQIHHYERIQRRAARKAELPTVTFRTIGGEESVRAALARKAERAAAEPERVHTVVVDGREVTTGSKSLRDPRFFNVRERGPSNAEKRAAAQAARAAKAGGAPAPAAREPSEADLREAERNARHARGDEPRNGYSIWKP